MSMYKIPMEDLRARHTEEIVERAENGINMFEVFIGELSEREKQIFEIAYANGYSDCEDDNEYSQPVKVLKYQVEFPEI